MNFSSKHWKKDSNWKLKVSRVHIGRIFSAGRLSTNKVEEEEEVNLLLNFSFLVLRHLFNYLKCLLKFKKLFKRIFWLFRWFFLFFSLVWWISSFRFIHNDIFIDDSLNSSNLAIIDLSFFCPLYWKKILAEEKETRSRFAFLAFVGLKFFQI